MPTKRSIILLAAAAGIVTLVAQNSSVPLEQGFHTPPDSAKPRTWWHWTNGNVTKEGITKDLEWMKRSGIGGFMLADEMCIRDSPYPVYPVPKPEKFSSNPHSLSGSAES